MHVLQPKQTKLTEEDVGKLLKQFNISLTQLPKIKITDPVLSGGFEIGEVIKIERIKEGGKSIYYRVVAI